MNSVASIRVLHVGLNDAKEATPKFCVLNLKSWGGNFSTMVKILQISAEGELCGFLDNVSFGFVVPNTVSAPISHSHSFLWLDCCPLNTWHRVRVQVRMCDPAVIPLNL